MKHRYNIFLLMGLLFFSGCSEWLDVNKDPNVPTEVGADLILPAAQASIAARIGGNLFNVSGFFAQYWAQAPEANQYNIVETYDLRTDFLDDDYTELWAGALNDLQRIITDSKEKENWGDFLASTVLKAYVIQYWVDMLDKVPYSEALQGIDFINPTWEDGNVVYAALIAEIDAALANITSESAVSNTDMLLSADINQWIGFANAMKLKLYMRERAAVDVTTQIQALITANNFMTVDVAFASFEDAVNKRNPWHETTQQLNTDANHVGTINIISFLSAKSDPRLSVLFDSASASKTFEGIYPAQKQIVLGLLTEDFSRPRIAATRPVYLYTLAELNLFIAEAQLMLNNNPSAAKASYEAAIDASLALHGVSEDLYSAPGAPYYFDVTATTNDLFEQIMMQKWVSLCAVNNLEAWCEIRRTDIPKYWGDYSAYGDGLTYVPGQFLNPAKNLLPDGVYMAQRLPYPDIAVSRNENTPKLTSTQSFVQKVWWDKN